MWRVSSYCSSSQWPWKSHHLALLKMASKPAEAVSRVWSGEQPRVSATKTHAGMLAPDVA